MLLVKAHFKNLGYLEYVNQTEAQTPVVFLVRNPFNAIVAERTRSLRAMVSEYWNDTHISSDIHESQFGEFRKRICTAFEHHGRVYLTQNSRT